MTTVALDAGSAVGRPCWCAFGGRDFEMGCVGSKNQRSEEPAAPAGGSGGFLDGATEPVLLAFIKPGARWEDDFTISFTTLGVGKWGTVKLAYNKHTGDKVAFKVRGCTKRARRVTSTFYAARAWLGVGL